MKQPTKTPAMRTFSIVWFGQIISLLGTGMTRFAITIWAWQVTGEATTLALVGFFSFGPTVLLSPIAGALVDRLNRKLVMMLSDLAAGLASVGLLVLFFSGNLQIWHLYIAGAFAGAFEAFQFPAYSAAISTMLPKEQYARASGMLSLAQSTSGIAAPILGGTLLAVIGLGGILVIDVFTFLVAVGALLVVNIPQPKKSEEGQASRGSLWQESGFGFRYIWQRPSLLGLQLVFFMGNFFASMIFVLIPAMILARTDNNELILGSVQSMMGAGGVVGGLVLSTWGGFRQRIHGVLLGWILVGLLEGVLFGLGQTVFLWAIAAFLAAFFIPFINGSNQAIWQAKVEPDVQGRVFAARRLIAQIAGPIAILLAGPLADQVFEPAMMPEGGLAPHLGQLIGTGPGAGIALMLVMIGLVITLVGSGGYVVRVIREAERILPDHDAQPMATTQAPA